MPTPSSFAPLSRCLRGAALAALAVVAPIGAALAQDTAVKVALPWVFQGPDSFMLVAEDKGYYDEVGLDVSIDAGRGAVDAINKVASGAYEFGFADLNNLVQFASESPDAAPVAVLMVYDDAPFSLFTLEDNGIASPEDMVGRSLGAPVFDASFKLFPAFAAATGIDEAAVERINMDGRLRETMLIRGEVDFISGHYHSAFIDLVARGVDPQDIVSFRFADYGLDFYGNAVLVNRTVLEERPEVVAAFVRATVRAIKDVAADPTIGAAAAKARDGLLDEQVELDRLKLALETLIVTPHTREAGFGDVDMARLARSIEQLAGPLALARIPAPEEVFDPSFLPPVEDRRFE